MGDWLYRSGDRLTILVAATQYYTIHLYDVSAQRSFSRPRPVARRSSSKSLSPTSPLALNALSGSTPRMPGAYSGTSGTSEPLSALTEEAAEAIDALEDDEEDEDWTDDEDEPALWPSSASRRRGVRDEDSSMKKIKTVQGEEGRWTITDCDSTRDGSRMIYSSITPYVHMLSTAEFEAEHTCLDFTGRRQRGRGFDGWGYDGFGVSSSLLEITSIHKDAYLWIDKLAELISRSGVSGSRPTARKS